jgi:hypothetical protein
MFALRDVRDVTLSRVAEIVSLVSPIVGSGNEI